MQQNKPGIYHFKIKSYESDFKGKMTLHAFFLFLQECAWQNALENGFGYEFVEKEKALWVLSRVKVDLDEIPNWKDTIQIKTWPRQAEGLLALRDYLLFSDEKIIARVSSSWLVLDKKTKRPRRIADFEFSKADFLSEKAIEKPIDKIIMNKDMVGIEERKVYSSDLDVNGHVNNATYVKWITDAHFSISKEQLKTFTINYISELYLEEKFTISYSRTDNIFTYLLKNSETGKEVCSAKLSY